MIEEGKYEATVKTYNIVQNSKGDLQAVITFYVSQKAGEISYYGGFSEKGREYTINNLITCGLKGNNPAGELELGKKVEIVVKHEEYEGKTRAKVKFINPIGGGAFKNLVSKDLALAKLSELEGAVMGARQRLNIVDQDEIPF